MSQKYLSAYYFHGQDACMVPKHVQADIQWMSDHGVDGVCVGVHESDMQGGNTFMVCDLVRDTGLDLWLIPSRLGGLTAGWHRAPGYLSVQQPDWCARNIDGAIRWSYAPQLSVFHPSTPLAIAEIVGEMITRFNPNGIVWDELKSLGGEDHSQSAIDNLGHPATEADMLAGTVRCFSQINNILDKQHSRLQKSCFIFADSSPEKVRACATIEGLNAYGCDGKAWYPDECDAGEGGARKVLLGGNMTRFHSAATEQGLTPFTLLETQTLDKPAMDLTMQRLPELLTHAQGSLAFYYYPYGMAEPERYMTKIGSMMAAWRQQENLDVK